MLVQRLSPTPPATAVLAGARAKAPTAAGLARPRAARGEGGSTQPLSPRPGGVGFGALGALVGSLQAPSLAWRALRRHASARASATPRLAVATRQSEEAVLVEKMHLNALNVFAKQIGHVLFVRVYSNSEFEIRDREALAMNPGDPAARFTQADCIHNVHLLPEIQHFRTVSNFAYDARTLTSLRAINRDVTVMITGEVESSPEGRVIQRNKWFLNDTTVFCKRSGANYIISVQSPHSSPVFHLNCNIVPLEPCDDDHEFTASECICGDAAYDAESSEVYTISLIEADSLVLEINCLALLVKSCISEEAAKGAYTTSANLKAWANIIPGSPPKEMFHTFPCFSESRTAEIRRKCESLVHLRTHDNFVLGNVGYKGDYIADDPMSIVDKNEMMRDHFQPDIDTMIEALSRELGEPVFTLPYVFLPGLHYQDSETPDFQHGRDIYFGEFHTDGQHTRLQRQLGDIEHRYGIRHEIDYDRRWTATCAVTVGGMFQYPSQELAACRRDDPHYSVEYKRGWINLHNGRWVHQIAPNRSKQDRICWQAHLVWCNDAERRGWLIYW